MPRTVISTARTAISTPRLAVRNYNAALSFDGSGDFVTLGNLSVLNPTDALSISAWIRLGNVTSTNTIFGKSDGGITQGYRLRVTNNGKVTFFVAAGGAQKRVDSDVTLVPGNLYHVVATADSTDARVYVNASLQTGDIQATGASLTTNGSSARIGDDPGATASFNGVISDVCFWNTVLTQSQVDGLYYQGDVPTTLLVGRWRLDEGAGSTVYDISGQGNNGTITGATFTSNTPMKSRKLVNGNMVTNGDQSFVPPFTAATTTSGRYVDGTAGGSTTNKLFGWDTTLEFAGAASFDSTNGNALKITTTTNPPSNNHRVSFENTISATAAVLKEDGIKIVAGTSYRVTFDMKTDSITSANSRGARCSVTSYSADVSGSTQELNFSYVSGTTGWTTYTGTFTATANRVYARLLLEIRGEEGTAWFRNIALTPTTPTTRTAVS